ncbi:MAG TPA: ketoacyl-ACP synthase III [Pyrinomonadaceae bacterium]|nr:ketoacyl-ACP synthase III [Pyrinomonadaceae bacterium]
MRAFITATGACLPELVITNKELASQLELDPEQIFKSSGIRQRHWVSNGVTTSSLASTALRSALQTADLLPSEIDYLLLGTMTADRFIPGSASAVQQQVGLGEIPSLDIRAACCNTLYGLQLARALIASGVARNVALCLAEVQSAFLRLEPVAGTTSMLFGDGAAALIISAEPGPDSIEILDLQLATNGSYVDDLGIRCPGSEFRNGSALGDDFYPRMVGQSVILQASRRMVAACQTVLERNGLVANDVRWVVPHQANANLLAQVARGLGLTDMSRVISVIEKTGNTSSASMGLALDELRHRGTIRAGDWILLPAFAAGFTWGAALCRAQ